MGAIWTPDRFIDLQDTPTSFIARKKLRVNNSATAIEYYDEPAVNVKDFGAKGDGGTNDTLAINNALSSSNNIVLPPGDYLISPSALTIPANTRFVGSGRHNTALVIDGAIADYLSVGSGCYIGRLRFKHTGTTPTSGKAINITGPWVTIEDIWIDSAWDAIYIGTNGVVGVYLIQLVIRGYQNDALYLSDVNDIYLSKFIFDAEAGNTTGKGMHLAEKVEAFVANDGDIIGGAYGLYTETTTYGIGMRPAYNKFTNVHFDSAVNGVSLNQIVVTRFTNCWFSNRPGNGCTLGQSDDVTFVQSEFFNCGSHGLNVKSSANGLRAISCSFLDNNTQNNGSHGLYLESNTDNFIVTGCTARNGLYSGNQQYGIYLANGNSSTYELSANLTAGNAIGGVYNGGSGGTL